MSQSDAAARIVDVDGCEILDSRGRPTVWCKVTVAGGDAGCASVPSGESTSRYERRELRDGERRYSGKGVRRAVENVRQELRAAVLGLEARSQRQVDECLLAADGTADLGRLGANAVLAVSIASAVAAARAADIPLYRYFANAMEVEPLLPLPMVNILSGGAHAGDCLDVQDFLIIPLGAESFSEAIEWSAAVREATRREASALDSHAYLAADEGGLGLQLGSHRAALDLLCAGIEAAGLGLGTEVAIAIDVAASHLACATGYRLRTENQVLSAQELVTELDRWRKDYPIVSIEDPVGEDDWSGWRLATRAMGSSLQLLGDDLFATDLARLEQGINEETANAVLVKPNQIGTLTGGADVVSRARTAGYATVVSARSGESEDSWLADLSVGWASGQIKVGSTTRSERTAKWNRLLLIEHELGRTARYAGARALAHHHFTGSPRPLPS